VLKINVRREKPIRSRLPSWKNIRKSRTSFTFALVAGGLLALLLVAVSYYYIRFSWLIDERLAGNIYQNTSQVFATPRRISVGEIMTQAELVHMLQSSGYSESVQGDLLGACRVDGAAVEILPSARSYFAGRNRLRVEFKGKRISRIRNLDSKARVTIAEIEPELITNIFDIAREKRRPVRFEDLPEPLVQAVLSAEDKRFFEHPGFDVVRVFGAAWTDIRRGEKAQGASTITMQVARSFFFTTRREWARKLRETFMALLLEQRFDKKQIFELYANQVYLGNRASFAMRGFGEAAKAYLGKDVRSLNLAESAFLAGILRAPNRYSSAERKPERVNEARDRVLAQMVGNGVISTKEADEARKTPIRLISGTAVGNSAGYFVDMVKDDLLERHSEAELIGESYRIYTTLDYELQRLAGQAVEWGTRRTDAQLAKRYEIWRKRGEQVPQVQAALVALDPSNGEVLALVGGRSYAASQLNRTLARRQPGSVFKPFVYAAAFENALENLEPVLTPVSAVVDEPTVFLYGGREYTPNNYGQEFYGTVTLRDALVRSLNVATVKVAESIGYKRVVGFVKQLGLDMELNPTPALALGAYEMTPLEVAAAYTVFAGKGVRSSPVLIRSVLGPDGKSRWQDRDRKKAVLDPRICYLITNILEDVINRGTAAGVRARGFAAPAAGKTGTSHDGWFAGYTSNLLCVVWVGFDDNRELGISGSASAAPIWTEFMKKALTLPRYRSAQPFERPDGVLFASIDPESQQLATSSCPVIREEVFIAGTEPGEPCSLHPDHLLDDVAPVSWHSRVFGGEDDKKDESPEIVENPKEKKERGFLKRLFEIGDDEEDEKQRERQP
jgi:penicillin-binding protein 1B